MLGFWFVLQIIDGLTSLGFSQSEGGGVAFFAHIGGFVAGAVIARIAITLGGWMHRPSRPPAVG